ncbi:MAG TPA: T9SS type A sorting domain-containing protein [Bacteroidales bacterium]|nr:T9SS type A sorting domain-containing protein [Bacteroidales bacterium]
MVKYYLLSIFVFLSALSTAQWGPVNNGISNLSFGVKLLGSSDAYIFSGTLADARMYRSGDNGNNWDEIDPPVTGNVPECGFFFEDKYFAGLNSSQECIFYSTDDGSSWNSVSGGPQTTWVRGFFSLSGDIFAFTSSAGIYKSTDGGSNWEPANSGLDNYNVIRMESINSKLLAATIGGGVFASTDNGETWFPSNNGIAGSDLNATLVWRMGAGLFYMEQGGAAYTSNDEGANWSAWIKPAVMGLAVNEIYRTGNHLYMESRHFAGGLKDSVYYSINEGFSWDNITDNLSASDLNASGITEFEGYAFIAYNIISPGLGIYRRGISTGTVEMNNPVSIEIYPNPFREKISFASFSRNNIKQINLFDNLGRLVLSENGSETVNTSGLPGGTYIVAVVLADNTTIRRKLIKENR